MSSQSPDAQELHRIPRPTDGPDEVLKQRWNDPPINKWRLFATFITFGIVGASDGVYGALVPSVRLSLTIIQRLASLYHPFKSAHILYRSAMNGNCQTLWYH